MPLNVIAPAKYLRELTCAYTGANAGVRMIGTGNAQLFFAEGAFDPGSWVKTSEELMKALGTRNGVEGVAQGLDALTCPYTGVRMAVQKDPVFGFRATGGFRPSRPQADPFRFAADMMTRGGVTPPNAPKRPRVRMSPPSEEPEAMDKVEIPLSDAMGAAEAALKDTLPVRPTVTVPAGAPRRGRK